MHEKIGLVTRPDVPLTANFTWRFRWTKRCTITARRSRSTCTFKTTPTNRSRKSKSLSDSSQTSAYSPQHSTSAQSQKWKASKHGFSDAFMQPKPCFLKSSLNQPLVHSKSFKISLTFDLKLTEAFGTQLS